MKEIAEQVLDMESAEDVKEFVQQSLLTKFHEH